MLFTDFDYSQPAEINERPQGSGFDWFGVEWEFVPAVMAPMVKPGTKRLTDVANWKEKLTFPDLSAIDWEPLAAAETAKWDRENKIAYMMLINTPAVILRRSSICWWNWGSTLSTRCRSRIRSGN